MHYILGCLTELETQLEMSIKRRGVLNKARNLRLLHAFAVTHGRKALTALEETQLKRGEKRRRLVDRAIMINKEQEPSRALQQKPPPLGGVVTRRTSIRDFETFCDELNSSWHRRYPKRSKV